MKPRLLDTLLLGLLTVVLAAHPAIQGFYAIDIFMEMSRGQELDSRAKMVRSGWSFEGATASAGTNFIITNCIIVPMKSYGIYFIGAPTNRSEVKP